MGDLGTDRVPQRPPTNTNLATTITSPSFVKEGPGRKKVNQACVYCQRSHMTCDKGRPCQRCVKRRIGHLCHDSPAPPSPSSPIAAPLTMIRPANGGRTRRDVSREERDVSREERDVSREERDVSREERDVSREERAAPSLGLREAAQILFDFHDRVDSIIKQHNPGPDASGSQPFDERQSYQSLLRFFDEQTRICSVINQLRTGLEQLRETYGRASWRETNFLVTHYSLGFDKVLATTTTPHLLVRPSGEILRANNSLASIVKVSASELTGHWRFCELLTEESYVNFAEKTTSLLFLGESQLGSLLTVCTVVPGGLRSLAPASSTAVSPLGVNGGEASSSSAASGSSSRGSLGLPASIRCALSISVRRSRQHVPLLMALSLIPLPDQAGSGQIESRG